MSELVPVHKFKRIPILAMVSPKWFESVGDNRLNQSKLHQNQHAVYPTVIAKPKRVGRDIV